MPDSAPALPDRSAQEAELGHPLEDLAVDLAALVPLADVGSDLGGDEVPHRPLHETVLRRQRQVDAHPSEDSAAPPVS